MSIRFLPVDHCMLLSPQELQSFPVLEEMCVGRNENCSNNGTVVEIECDKDVFLDLLRLYTVPGFSKKVQQNVVESKKKGYLRKLFTMHCFFGNQSEDAEQLFLFLFEQVLQNASDTQMRHIVDL